jgi:hypothetical protein
MAEGTGVSDSALLADAISKMDALRSRMDELEVGEKNIIKGDNMTPKTTILDKTAKSDDDDDKKDSVKKSDDDDDKKDSTKKSDDDDDKKDSVKKSDDDDDKKADEFPPKKKEDSAKKADGKKRGDDGELEIKGKKEDSAKKSDDDDDDKKDSVKKSDDDDDKKDSTKADSIGVLRRQISDQADTIRRLEALMKPRSDDEHYAFAEAQAKADSVFGSFGQRAPRPMEGELLDDYRCRLATKLKSHSKAWGNVKLGKLPSEAFAIAEGQIYADAATAAANPVDLAAGELREVQKVDPATGLRTIVFYGKDSFVKAMGRPGRRVQSFRTLSSQ